MKHKNKCRHCKSRYLGCHDECVDYQAFRKERDEICSLISKYNREQNDIMLHKESGYQKVIKRDNRRRNTK